MIVELVKEAIDNFSLICKGGKEAAAEMINRHGDIIKKETDKYGNIKYYFSEHDYHFFDKFYVEMAQNE